MLYVKGMGLGGARGTAEPGTPPIPIAAEDGTEGAPGNDGDNGTSAELFGRFSDTGYTPADGQEGGSPDGTRLLKAGNGGHGGKGGRGGNGSGATGGPSYALVYHVDIPLKMEATVMTVGPGGAKGIGGQADETIKAPDGYEGKSFKVVEVP